MDGVMVHPSDGEAWKQFNRVHPYFLMESHNISLGLCIGESNSFELFVEPFSCWPVIFTIYNLPLGMCMRLWFWCDLKLGKKYFLGVSLLED
jgi:hypothetical protein